MVVKTHPRPGGAELIGDEFERSAAQADRGLESTRTVRLNPADKLAISYILIITALILFSAKRINLWVVFCVAHVVVVGLILLIARVLPVSSVSGTSATSSRLLLILGSFIRGWYPVLLIPVTYKELTYLIPRIHPRDFDATLAAIDYRFLGFHPTVWLERFTWPPLTEVLQLTYSCYYFLPIVLGIVLWRRQNADFYFWVFVVVLGFYVSYLGYVSVPATGPRFLAEITESQTIPLTGIWLFAPVREMLDRAEGITRDCFPSGHTELTLLVLYYAFMFQKKVFWWLLPIGTGIIISTVYLRYHYLIDVVAGALVAIVLIAIAKPVYRALGGRLESY